MNRYSIFSLVRNVGQGVGISLVTTVLAHMMQVNSAELATRVTLSRLIRSSSSTSTKWAPKE